MLRLRPSGPYTLLACDPVRKPSGNEWVQRDAVPMEAAEPQPRPSASTVPAEAQRTRVPWWITGVCAPQCSLLYAFAAAGM